MIFSISITGQLKALTQQRQQLEESISQLAEIENSVKPLSEKIKELKQQFPDRTLNILWELFGLFLEGEEQSDLSLVEGTIAQLQDLLSSLTPSAKSKPKNKECPFYIGQLVRDRKTGNEFEVARFKRFGHGYRIFDDNQNHYKGKDIVAIEAITEGKNASDLKPFSQSENSQLQGFNQGDRVKLDDGSTGAIAILDADRKDGTVFSLIETDDGKTRYHELATLTLEDSTSRLSRNN